MQAKKDTKENQVMQQKIFILIPGIMNRLVLQLSFDFLVDYTQSMYIKAHALYAKRIRRKLKKKKKLYIPSLSAVTFYRLTAAAAAACSTYICVVA